MSHLVPRYELAQLNLEGQYTFDFLDSHTNVALGVLMGNYDAGVVKAEIFEQYKEKGLKKLASTKPYSEHLFIATQRLSPPKTKQIEKALLDIDTPEKAKQWLADFHPKISGLSSVTDSDYDNLRDVFKWLKQQGIAP